MNSHLLNLSAKPAKSSESNWAFYYSVNAQSLLMFLVSVYLVLLSPFSTESENEHVNFIYDFVFGRLDSIQVSILYTVYYFIIHFPYLFFSYQQENFHHFYFWDSFTVR